MTDIYLVKIYTTDNRYQEVMFVSLSYDLAKICFDSLDTSRRTISAKLLVKIPADKKLFDILSFKSIEEIIKEKYYDDPDDSLN